MDIVSLAYGLVLGAVYIAVGRFFVKNERRFFAWGLCIAAVIYFGFALMGNGSPTWIAIELAGSLGFGLLAWMGVKRSPWWLIVGWAVHPLWDYFLHMVGGGAVFSPAWYAVACLSFDLLVAIYLAVVELGNGK